MQIDPRLPKGNTISVQAGHVLRQSFLGGHQSSMRGVSLPCISSLCRRAQEQSPNHPFWGFIRNNPILSATSAGREFTAVLLSNTLRTRVPSGNLRYSHRSTVSVALMGTDSLPSRAAAVLLHRVSGRFTFFSCLSQAWCVQLQRHRQFGLH